MRDASASNVARPTTGRSSDGNTGSSRCPSRRVHAGVVLTVALVHLLAGQLIAAFDVITLGVAALVVTLVAVFTAWVAMELSL